MREALLGLLQAIESQTTLSVQIAADVAALKLAFFQLDARAKPLFEQQAVITHDTFRAFHEAHRREIETLRQLFSQLPTSKPN